MTSLWNCPIEWTLSYKFLSHPNPRVVGTIYSFHLRFPQGIDEHSYSSVCETTPSVTVRVAAAGQILSHGGKRSRFLLARYHSVISFLSRVIFDVVVFQLYESNGYFLIATYAHQVV